VKKEGTGAPKNPDIDFTADVKARELRFEEVPETEVRFRGNTERNSVSSTERENLPDKIQEGVTYRNASVRLRIASELVEGENLSGKPVGGTEKPTQVEKTSGRPNQGMGE
jgi:hypothetical protein